MFKKDAKEVRFVAKMSPGQGVVVVVACPRDRADCARSKIARPTERQVLRCRWSGMTSNLFRVRGVVQRDAPLVNVTLLSARSWKRRPLCCKRQRAGQTVRGAKLQDRRAATAVVMGLWFMQTPARPRHRRRPVKLLFPETVFVPVRSGQPPLR